MNIGVISKRYAKALYEYAQEHNAQAAIYENMLQLKDVLRRVKELPVVLKNPSLSLLQKTSLICSAVTPSPVFVNFITLVVKHGREDMLLYIAYAYIGLYRQKNRVVAIKITTAAPMSESFLQKVENLVETQENVTVEMKNVVDEAIIGGFLCEAFSARYDASVKSQLAEVRKKLVKLNKKIV